MGRSSDLNSLKTCAVIGAGNVATHIAPALSRRLKVRQIYSRNLNNAQLLADNIGGAAAIDSLDSLQADLDLYLVSVSDDVIADIVEATSELTSGIWAHTSGSVSASIFAGKENYGVFYPLQTFSKAKVVDISKVPFFIEGNNPETSQLLFDLAESISDTVYYADSDRRKNLHIAAVFACNFANYMWKNADDLLRKEGLDVKVFRSLLQETLDKLEVMSPEDAQTGPARRGDVNIMNTHAAMLDTDKRELYQNLSNRIMKLYNE